MKFSDYIKLAISALYGNRLRSILTLLIISFGIMALIIIFTCIDAIKGNVTDNFIELGAGAFTIQKEEGISKRRGGSGDLAKLTYNEAESFVNKFKFPANVSVNTTAAKNVIVKTKFGESNPNVSVEAGDIDYIDIAGKTIAVGRNFTEIEQINGSDVTILGYDAAAKVYPALDSVVGSKILIDGKKYAVIGLLESKGASAGKNDNFALIPYTNGRKQFDLSQASFNIIVEAPDPNVLEKAIAEAEGVMRNVKKLGPLDASNFSIVRSDKLANTMLEQISSIEIATVVIGFLTLLGAGVGLMNIMLVSVNERTREIGLSKSLGATRKTIFMQFLIEAVTICIVGGIVGVILGLILGNMIAILVLKSSFTLSVFWVTGGILFCTFIGLTAGLFPAYRASKLNPVDALRYE